MTATIHPARVRKPNRRPAALPESCPPLPPLTPGRSALLLAELEESCARRGLPPVSSEMSAMEAVGTIAVLDASTR